MAGGLLDIGQLQQGGGVVVPPLGFVRLLPGEVGEHGHRTRGGGAGLWETVLRLREAGHAFQGVSEVAAGGGRGTGRARLFLLNGQGAVQRRAGVLSAAFGAQDIAAVFPHDGEIAHGAGGHAATIPALVVFFRLAGNVIKEVHLAQRCEFFPQVVEHGIDESLGRFLGKAGVGTPGIGIAAGIAFLGGIVQSRGGAAADAEQQRSGGDSLRGTALEKFSQHVAAGGGHGAALGCKAFRVGGAADEFHCRPDAFFPRMARQPDLAHAARPETALQHEGPDFIARRRASAPTGGGQLRETCCAQSRAFRPRRAAVRAAGGAGDGFDGGKGHGAWVR